MRDSAMARFWQLYHARPRTTLLALILSCALLVGLGATAGCTAPQAPRLVTDDDLSGKIPAMKIAADTQDESAEPQLVQDLESDDPAVRFYAIEALKKLTGQTHDYVYYAPADQRMEAVQRWQQWLKNQAKAGSTLTPAIPPGVR